MIFKSYILKKNDNNKKKDILWYTAYHTRTSEAYCSGSYSFFLFARLRVFKTSVSSLRSTRLLGCNIPSKTKSK